MNLLVSYTIKMKLRAKKFLKHRKFSKIKFLLYYRLIDTASFSQYQFVHEQIMNLLILIGLINFYHSL